MFFYCVLGFGGVVVEVGFLFKVLREVVLVDFLVVFDGYVWEFVVVWLLFMW